MFLLFLKTFFSSWLFDISSKLSFTHSWQFVIQNLVSRHPEGGAQSPTWSKAWSPASPEQHSTLNGLLLPLMLGTSTQVLTKRRWKVVVSWDTLCKPTVCKPLLLDSIGQKRRKKHTKPKSANFQSMTQHVKRLRAMNNQVLVVYPFASKVSTNNRGFLNFHKTFGSTGWASFLAVSLRK